MSHPRVAFRRFASPGVLALLGLVITTATGTIDRPALAQAQPQPTVQSTFTRIDQLQEQAAARQRAINLARNTVVKLNGGLTRYMPAACMFANGGSGGSCLVQDNAQGFLFRFDGGAPGWQQLGQAPTTSSEVLISPDGRSVLQVAYNGPVR